MKAATKIDVEFQRLVVAVTALLLFVGLIGIESAGAQTDVPEPSEVTTNKRAQTGMKFLTVSASPRAAAMGNAITASSRGSSWSLFYNPASMARISQQVEVGVSKASWLTDISYNFGTASYQPANGQYGVFGASVAAVDYGDVNKVIRADTESGYRKIGSYSPSAVSLGLGYAQSFSDRFSAGGQIKYARQSLGDHVVSRSTDGSLATKAYTNSTLAYDFGVLYDTGFRSLTFAMSTRNFSQELTYVRENYELPLTFRIGLNIDLIDFTNLDGDLHNFLLSVDGRRPRDFSEQVRVGAEYTFMNLLSLRGGYGYPNSERALSLGGGLNLELGDVGLNFDYAYTQFGVFGGVNRLALTASL